MSTVLIWLLTAVCIKTGRPQIARRAIELGESRLSKDNWPRYYDGKLGQYIGKQARKYQTWCIAGYLPAKMMLDDPSHLGMISKKITTGTPFSKDPLLVLIDAYRVIDYNSLYQDICKYLSRYMY